MNGFVHGVEYVRGFAYYKIILIVWDTLAVVGFAFLSILLIRRIRRHDDNNISSEEKPDSQESPQTE